MDSCSPSHVDFLSNWSVASTKFLADDDVVVEATESDAAVSGSDAFNPSPLSFFSLSRPLSLWHNRSCSVALSLLSPLLSLSPILLVLHKDWALLHSCTVLSVVTELVLDHSSTAFALAQGASQNRVPFDTLFLAVVWALSILEFLVELRATESCHSCCDGGVWLTSLSVIFVLIESGSSKPFGVLAWEQEARRAPSSARVMRAEGCRIWSKPWLP